jgi:GAF domain-containing protein
VYTVVVSIDDGTSAAQLDEASEALEALNSVLAGEESIERALSSVAESVVRMIADADAVSVTVVEAGGASTAAATDETVIAIDTDQYAAGEGPGLEAAATRKPVRVTVQGARERWPAFAAAAERAGVRAYLSAPLVVSVNEEDELVGALNVYGYEENAFDPFDEALLRLFTTAASGAITGARRNTRSRDLIEGLRRALVSRADIDQAKGALMAVHGFDAAAAFQKLVGESQRTNTKLNDVARTLLASLRTD